MVKKEKERCASFAPAPQTTKATITMCKCLVKKAKGTTFVGVRHEQKMCSCLCQRVAQNTLSLYGDFSKGSLKCVTPSYSLQMRDGYRFRNSFGLKKKYENYWRERPHSHNFYHNILLYLFYFLSSYCCLSLIVPNLWCACLGK